MTKKTFFLFVIAFAFISFAQAEENLAQRYFQQGISYEKQGENFASARYYFQSSLEEGPLQLRALAHARIARNLSQSGMYQGASYFFLKAIGSGYRPAILEGLEAMNSVIDNVGDTIFKRYLLRYVDPKLYTPEQKNYYLYILAKGALAAGKPAEVIAAVNQIQSDFIFYPQAKFLRASAYLFLNRIDDAITDFRFCSDSGSAKRYASGISRGEMNDLNNRCVAGVARAYYQVKQYDEAERWYDEVALASLAWPQVQYERAWNSVARGDYNRALGKLVTYKAPGLSWFVNSEIEMLRAMSYLQLCLYADVDKEVNEFIARYSRLGVKLKELLNSDTSREWTDERLYNLGVKVLSTKIHSEDPLHQIMNRFVRSSNFIQWAGTKRKVEAELRYLDSLGPAGNSGLGGFLREVLGWRLDIDAKLAADFLRDRLTTEYRALLQNVQTIDIVKLEVLRRAKKQLEASSEVNEAVDVWGNKKRGSLGWPRVENDQYGWSFNGEFWADELGSYVFALRPECEQ